MQKQINSVKEFHTSFKLGYSENIIGDLGESKNLLRYNLMKEENEEYLEAAQNNDITEIADALGHDKVSGAVNRAIKELLAKQLIEYTIPDKPNSRLQKYRLTPLGRRLLATEGNRHES